MSTSLEAQIRTDFGKSATRKLRASGRLPAVIYAGGKEATSVHIDPKYFERAMRGPLRRNVLITLEMAGKDKKVMVRDIQINSLRRNATHVDFLEVDEAKPVVVRVPFEHFGKSAAVASGAKISIVKRTLKVSCLPGKVPVSIKMDVTNVEVGPTRCKVIEMPEGTTLLEDLESTVMTVSRSRGEVAVDPEQDAPAAAAAE